MLVIQRKDAEELEWPFYYRSRSYLRRLTHDKLVERLSKPLLIGLSLLRITQTDLLPAVHYEISVPRMLCEPLDYRFGVHIKELKKVLSIQSSP